MPPPGSRYSSDCAPPATTSGRTPKSSSVPRSTASTAARPAPSRASTTPRPTNHPASRGARKPSPNIFARRCKRCRGPAWHSSASRMTRTLPIYGPTSSNSGLTGRRNETRRAQCIAPASAPMIGSMRSRSGARIAGVSFLYEPVIPDGTLGGIPVDLIELQREENSKLANDAVSRFEAGAKKAGVSAETRILDATFGGAATLFAQIARRFDLAVVGQAQREGSASDDLVVEAALFESGRPMVVVPYIQKRGMTLERVLACWDGGRTAARAIGDAMPFLERAKAVDIVIVAEERKADEVDGANMSEHLTRHGVAASLKRIAKGDLAVEDVLLSYAADSGADFMVMGGYGHSRLREFILGGVT